MGMTVRMAVIMITVMMIVIMMIMDMMIVPMVTVPMPMLIMRVMMQPLARPRSARVFAEHQRLDGDRNGVGGQPDAAEVDVVEIHQHHAVDDEDVARDAEFLAQDRAQRLGDVAVEHDVDRLA